MNSERRNNLKLFGIIAGALVLVATAYVVVEVLDNKGLEEALQQEKVISESRLSERLLTEKEVAHLQAELVSLKEQNSVTNKHYQETLAELTVAKNDLNRIRASNQTVASLRAKNQELQNKNTSLNERIAAYEISEQQLQASRDEFSLALAATEGEIENLKAKLDNLIKEGRTIRQALIETTTRTGKLTVKAKRAKTITVGGELPEDVEEPSFKIINPAGTELKESEGVLSSYLSGSEQKSQTGFNRFQMTFKSRHKLKAGLYTIQILEGAGLIGSLQVRLR